MTEENNHHSNNNNNNNNNHHHQSSHRHHHHNNNDEEQSLECSDIKDVIDKILRQANMSYETNYEKLDNFTQILFQEHHQEHHNQWRHKHLDWLYPDKKQLKFDDYDKQLPEEVLSHLRMPGAPNKQELARELTDLYLRLQLLMRTFEFSQDYHNNSSYELMNRYPNNKYIQIIEYFKKQDNYIRALLTETRLAMEKLGIDKPEFIFDDKELQSYPGVPELRDWIITREHLKLLYYVLKAYEILLNRCS